MDNLSMPEDRVADFFAYTRKRHQIYISRQQGKPGPWTTDPILERFRFTCVFRELDRTTQWIRHNIRDGLRDRPECLLAMVVARWFNRIETLEVIFNQMALPLEGTVRSPWEFFLETGDTYWMRAGLLSALPDGPYVTGSYMIRSPTGASKLDGMLDLCRQFWHNSGWRAVGSYMLHNPGEITMEGFTWWLRRSPGQGPFLAYEVACDLQHTDFLARAPDVMTWANVGPGCLRGLNRISGRTRLLPRKPSHKYRADLSEADALREMSQLLRLSGESSNWPRSWQSWDMRTVEHNLCEFDKYERVRTGEGVPRQVFRPSAPLNLSIPGACAAVE